MQTAKACLALFFGGLIILLAPTLSEARVRGVCSNCHTMHNSQNGISVVAAGAQPALLANSCVGCHSGTNTGGANVTPYVLDTTSEPTTSSLAGGNFYWVRNGNGTKTADRLGHNVLNMATAADVAMGVTPPGNGDPASPLPGTRMSCAGTTGCHGVRATKGSGEGGGNDILALTGSHHGTAGTAGYRFLQGVEGLPDDDWEFETFVDHNWYKGAARPDDNQLNNTTISSLCAQCHGNFHNGSNPVDGGNWGSPWVRHPTDFDMATLVGTEFAAYTYDAAVPVAYSDPATHNDKIVMCLSCHRAHGSPNEAILRWDYRKWPGSGTNGCLVCHTSKN
ncbi:MAG: hypothetical protein OEV91_03900 [Desulfobulbaceae bacterium]|nr:hypothetical protein [Desulfobulbaceae bacterium]